MCPSPKTIWHPSIDNSALVGAVGSSTTCQGIWEEARPPTCQVICIQTVACEPAPAPLSHGREDPGKPTITHNHPRVREPLWMSRFLVGRFQHTVGAKNNNEFGHTGEGQRNICISHPQGSTAECQERSSCPVISPTGESKSM